MYEVHLQTQESTFSQYSLRDVGGRPQAAVSFDLVVCGWVRAAAAAGAHLPAAVGGVLMTLCRTEDDRTLRPTRAEVVAVLYAAADQVREESDHSLPVPRGMVISLDPRGDLRLEWETETHLVTFFIPCESFRRDHLNPEGSWASVQCRHEDHAGLECYRVKEFLGIDSAQSVSETVAT